MISLLSGRIARAAQPYKQIQEDKAVREGRARMFVVGNSHGYYRPWAPSFSLVFDLDEADVALFTGGSDISPELYGEKNHGLSHPFPERDAEEVEAFNEIKKRNMPMIGICRGAQLITALNGGKLFQHVNFHAGRDHEIITDTGERFPMTTVHHQMMRPSGEYRLIAWTPSLSQHYFTDSKLFEHKNPDFGVDPEIVFYPGIKALCIQGHPEMMPTDCPTNQFCRRLAEDLLLKETQLN